MGARLQLPSMAGDVLVTFISTNILSVETGPRAVDSKGYANKMYVQ